MGQDGSRQQRWYTTAAMISMLPERIAALSGATHALCDRLFFVQRVEGATVIPEAMAPWVARNFGGVERVRRQTIVRVVNRFTLEGALFNPLRALRPAGAAVADADLDAWIASELEAVDLFARPLHDTTADLFGRIQGRFCVSASNIAKYDRWHGLVIFDEPHPLRFDRERLTDYLDVALRWIAAAHSQDAHAIYPMITWNCLPRSGATIAHGHMQMSLARDMHYSRIEAWRRAALHYGGAQRYFSDLATVHAELDLSLPGVHEGWSFVHLTPLRNREAVVLSSAAPDDAMLAERLAVLLYPILRALIDDQGMRSFNLGIALPPIGAPVENWRGMPVIARIADRGPALSVRNDWGAMELYATGCITTDPFQIAALLRQQMTGYQ